MKDESFIIFYVRAQNRCLSVSLRGFLKYFVVLPCDTNVIWRRISCLMEDQNVIPTAMVNCVLVGGFVCPLNDSVIDDDSRREWSGR